MKSTSAWKRALLSLGAALVLVGSWVLVHPRPGLAEQAKAVTVQAAGRGKPYFNFGDGQEMIPAFRGDQSLTAALQSGQAQPRSLASIDIDRDGTPEVFAGYSYNGAGLLTIQHGNPDAFAPKDESVFARMQQGYNPEPLLPTAEVYPVPAAADFLQVGDFNHDNQRDVLVAATTGQLFLLPGDGLGGLGTPEQIALPGAITSLTSGQFCAADGWTDVAVGVVGPAGPELIIYDGVDGVGGKPMRLSLSAPATAVEFGQVDSSPFQGAAVATGNQIEIIHGWGRKQSPWLESRVEMIDAGGNVRGVAIGSFIWNRQATKQIATFDEDGTVRIMARGALSTEPFSDAEIDVRARSRQNMRTMNVDVETLAGWQPATTEQWSIAREVLTGNVVAADATAQNLFQRSHISFMGTDDLLMMNANQQKLDIVRQTDETAGPQTSLKAAGDMVTASLNTTANPVAVLALPQKLNGERSLLVMQAGIASATVIPLAPTATITVDRTDDPNGANLAAASVCGVGGSDCSLRGAVQFANANPGTTISLGTNTYLLSTNGGGGCVVENNATGNTIGDLEINKTTTLTGNGSANTIIRQAAATNDRVICMDVPLTANLTFAFSGMTIAGGRDTSINGGAGMLGGALDCATNFTDVTFVNNQYTGINASGGGALVTGGSMTVTNCTFGAANLPGADRTNLTLANAATQTSGGGLAYTSGDPAGSSGALGTLTMTGTTFTHNTTGSGGAGGGGLDVFGRNLSTPTVNVSTGSFTSNQATGTASGGAIINESANLTIATTSITSNSANNRGGGLYVAGGTTLLDGTNPSLTFSSNTAPVNPNSSSISTASALNVSGTNTTIGGSIEITLGGIWTTNTGTNVNPTDILIAGGTMNCNNSTMNMTGNLTIQPSGNGLVGGTFNGNTGTVNLAGNFTFTNNGTSVPLSTLNAGTGTFNFNGSGSQSISNNTSITFNNLTDSNTTQPLTLNNSLAVNGTLSINGANAILAPVAATVISGTGTLNGSGTARVTRTAATADFSSQYTITNKTISGMTVEYIGAAAQTVSALTYNNLKINNASGATLAAGTTTVNGTLTLTNGAMNVSSNTLTLNNGTSVGSGTLTSLAAGTVNYNQSSVGQSVLAGIYGNLTFSNFNKVLPNGGAIGVAGTFTPGTATGHTITGNTFNFNGAAAQTVPAFNYNNLQISGARTINTSVTLANGGTIGVAGTFQPTATFSGTGGYITTNNTVDYNGTAAQGVGAFNFNNLTISGNKGGAAITFINGGTIGVAGTFNPAATNNTYVVTGNTFTFNGAALQTIPAFTFNSLTLNNAAGANLGGAVTAGGALTLTNGTLGVGTNTLTLNGAVVATVGTLSSAATGTVNYNQGSNGQATVLAINYGNLTFSSFNKTLASAGAIGIAGTFTPGAATGHTITGSTINFNNAGPQSIPGFTYNNLTSSGGAVARTLDPVNTIKIAGAFTPGTNVYTIAGSTIEYNGSSAQALPATFTTYNNLTLNNAAGTTGFAGLTVQGTIDVKAGTFTSSSIYNNVLIESGATLAATAASTINVSGSWTNNGGTFTANTGTVNFNGGATQTIGGTTATTFNNLTNSNPAGITMANDNTVNGALALTAADITVQATRTLTQPAAGTSSGTFDVNGRVQRNGFVTGGAVLSFGNPFNTIQVTAGGAPANIVVDLARSVPTGGQGFPTAVQRTYTITPSAAGFTGTVRLHYLPGELNSNNPATLNLWRFDALLPTPGWRPNPATSRDCAAGCTTNNSNFWVERTGVTSFSPWTLNSTVAPTAGPGVITGRIVDANGNPVEGAVVRLAGAQTRKFITDANGVYRFDNVETGGLYTVTPSRANYEFNPSMRSFNAIGQETQAIFTAVPTSGFVNPLDTPEYFVRQHYLDFLGREPDEAGFNFWSDQMIECGGDVDCAERRRENVSAAFYLSIEFRKTGGLVDGLYRASYGGRPQFADFMPDTRTVGLGVRVGDAGWEDKLAANKDAFVAAFVNRAAFHARYDGMDAASFVDALIANTGVGFTASERNDWISGLANGNQTRGDILRSIAENGTFVNAKLNDSFVMMQYFGYLRRDADASGFAFWLNKLNQFNGNFEQAEMVKAFIVSGEYRDRFPR